MTAPAIGIPSASQIACLFPSLFVNSESCLLLIRRLSYLVLLMKESQTSVFLSFTSSQTDNRQTIFSKFAFHNT